MSIPTENAPHSRWGRSGEEDKVALVEYAISIWEEAMATFRNCKSLLAEFSIVTDGHKTTISEPNKFFSQLTGVRNLSLIFW
jgi:hypothetical protein